MTGNLLTGNSFENAFVLAVTKCLDVLKSVLPNEVVMQIIAEHYMRVNTASASHDSSESAFGVLTEESECEQFAEVMLKMVGYPDVDSVQKQEVR